MVFRTNPRDIFKSKNSNFGGQTKKNKSAYILNNNYVQSAQDSIQQDDQHLHVQTPYSDNRLFDQRKSLPVSTIQSTMKSVVIPTASLMDNPRLSQAPDYLKTSTKKELSRNQFSRTDLLRRVEEKRQKDLNEIYGHIKVCEKRESAKKFEPATLDLSMIVYQTNSVEDLVQKNFIKYSGCTQTSYTQIQDNSDQKLKSKSLTNFAKLNISDQQVVKAVRRAEFNSQQRRDQALLTSSLNQVRSSPAGSRIQSYYQSIESCVSNDQSRQIQNHRQTRVQIVPNQGKSQPVLIEDIKVLKRKDEEQLNDRLMKVYEDIEEINISKKKLSQKNTQNMERSEKMCKDAEQKKPTLYNQIKTLHIIKGRVGPAYSRIVKEKRRAELIKTPKRQPSRVAKARTMQNTSAIVDPYFKNEPKASRNVNLNTADTIAQPQSILLNIISLKKGKPQPHEKFKEHRSLKERTARQKVMLIDVSKVGIDQSLFFPQNQTTSLKGSTFLPLPTKDTQTSVARSLHQGNRFLQYSNSSLMIETPAQQPGHIIDQGIVVSKSIRNYQISRDKSSAYLRPAQSSSLGNLSKNKL